MPRSRTIQSEAGEGFSGIAFDLILIYPSKVSTKEDALGAGYLYNFNSVSCWNLSGFFSKFLPDWFDTALLYQPFAVVYCRMEKGL